MRQAARHSPEAEHTVWWLLLCRAAERAARAAAFREAADFLASVTPDNPMTARDCADALRARAEESGR